METVASALAKFAPDLAEQLIDRWRQANQALDDFVDYLRKQS